MQQQNGVSDCGLFATAVCTALAFKANPSELRWDQSRMRSHLSRCLSNQILALFPTLYTGNEKLRGRREMTIDLYCVCNMPESFSNYMTKCCECSQWFHNPCVDFSDTRSVSSKIARLFKCPDCILIAF